MVSETRVVLTVSDYAAAVRTFTEGLGLDVVEEFSERGPGCVLEAGVATIEILSEGHSDYVDELETGQRQKQNVRIALRVGDTESATSRLVALGAEIIGPPDQTPWGSVNSRVGYAGLQMTLFAETG